MKHALIIGCGFIGHSLVCQLISSNFTVTVLDRNPCPSSLFNKVRWFQGSVSQFTSYNQLLNDVDVVYHLVSSNLPCDSISDISSALQSEVFSALTIFEACQDSGISKFIFASSSAVYGLASIQPTPEISPAFPISIYGINKSLIEQLLFFRSRAGATSLHILRISNPYGPGQPLFGRQGFIAIAIGKALSNKPLVVREPSSFVRDFIYISDLVFVLQLVGSYPFDKTVINVSTGIGSSLAQVIHCIENLASVSFRLVPEDPLEGDIRTSVLDPSLLLSLFDIPPFVSLESGLSKTLRYHGLF